MTAMVYDGLIAGFARGELDWIGDAFRVVLVKDGYEPNTSHTSRADLGDYELGTVPGYDRGGSLLRSRQLEADGSNGLRLTGGEVAWDNFTGEFRYAVICQDNGSASNDRLVALTDLGKQSFTDAHVAISYSQQGICVFAPEVTSG